MVKKRPLSRPVSSAAEPAVLHRAKLTLVSGGVAESAPAQQQSEMAMAVIGNLR